jgi:hypothetical protein
MIKFLCVMAVALASIGGTAGAATVIYGTTGSATGIQDLVVDSQTYDVAFNYGTYAAVYSGGATFSNATSLLDAIADVLNTTPYTTYIEKPAGTPSDFRVPLSVDNLGNVSYYTSSPNPFSSQ